MIADSRNGLLNQRVRIKKLCKAIKSNGKYTSHRSAIQVPLRLADYEDTLAFEEDVAYDDSDFDDDD